MLHLEVFDQIASFTNATFPHATGDGTVDLVGCGVLSLVLFLTTGFHPWLVVPNLLVTWALNSAQFQEQWTHWAEQFSPGVFTFLIGGLIPCTVYWINGFVLLLLEVNWPNPNLRKRIRAFKEQYKVQKGQLLNIVLDGDEHVPGQLRVLHVVKNLIIGQVCVLIPAAWLLGYLSTMDIGARNTTKLPGAWEMSADIAGAIIVDEVLFYYGHRLFHEVKWFYRNIHKIHHEFQYPCGLVAAYAHPVEMLVSNVLPLGLGLFLLRVNYFTAMVWACAAVVGTQTHHSGYRWPYTLPFDNQPDYHDFHHSDFNSNFGLLGWCDALHGTDKKYWDTLEQRKRSKAKAQ